MPSACGARTADPFDFARGREQSSFASQPLPCSGNGLQTVGNHQPEQPEQSTDDARKLLSF